MATPRRITLIVDKEHVKRVIAVRRALCIGEEVTVIPADSPSQPTNQGA